MKSYLKLLLAAIWMSTPCLKVCAEAVLTKDAAGIAAGRYCRNRIAYRDAGASGEGVLWDFSGVDFSGPGHKVVCEGDTMGRYRVTGDRKVDYYIVSEDTISQIAEEMPLWQTVYSKPVCHFKDGMVYGDSIQAPFEGYGLYSGSRFYKQQGVAKVVADATGEMIVGASDTLRNVLRVYRLRSYAIAMGPNLASLDTTRMKQVIEENYSWYVKGVPNPVFETFSSATYDNDTQVGAAQYAYCSLPDNIAALTEKKPNTDTDATRQPQPDVILYTVTVEEGKVTVQYSLDSKAAVSMILADNMGIVYESRRFVQEQGSGYQTSFSLAGLRPGVYTLYINANGTVHSEKVRR